MVFVCDTAGFIARWASSGAAKRANCQNFLSELCDLLGAARPNPTTPTDATTVAAQFKSARTDRINVAGAPRLTRSGEATHGRKVRRRLSQ